MRVLRASEIGIYLYCQRAWWYQCQGIPSENQSELNAGSLFHQEHGQKAWLARGLRLAGWVIFILAFILLAVALTLRWLE